MAGVPCEDWFYVRLRGDSRGEENLAGEEGGRLETLDAFATPSHVV